MPWCEDCNHYWSPNSMGPAGQCPQCERVIADPPRAPWHFWVLLVGVAGYLGWRLLQGVVWVIQHI